MIPCAKERFELGRRADLLVIYQSHDVDLFPVIEARRRDGKKTLVEYNDNFYAPPPASPVGPQWSSPLIRDVYEDFMNEGDGVIVTGEGLDELLRPRISKPIHILQNHLPFDPPSPRAVPHGPRVILGWAGSLGHMADLLAFVPVLKALMEAYPALVFHVMGNEAIPDQLDLPRHRLVHRQWGTMDDYFEFLKTIDIGLIPLLDTPYNRCRSDVKALEMSAHGVLPILPDALTYTEFLRSTGVEPYGDFRDCISLVRKYIDDRSVWQKDLEACSRYVRGHRVGRVNRERYHLYASHFTDSSLSAHSSWPVSTGYHEILGTPEGEPESRTLLRRVQKDLEANAMTEAQALLEDAAEQNRHSAEIVFAYAFCIARASPDPTPIIREASRRFRRDLRFPLLLVRRATDVQSRISAWNALFLKLSALSPEEREYFRAEIVRLFCEDLSRLKGTPVMSDLGEQVLSYFPDSAQLRFELAHIYERRGETSKALAHFEWLTEARKLWQGNHQFLSTLQEGYVSTWIEALKGRKKEQF